MLIAVPVGYESESIKVVIDKQLMRITQEIEVVDGFVSLDLSLVPDGFFSPWTEVYELSYYAPLTNKHLTFTAVDGKSYSSACFSFELTETEETTVTINPFI